MIKKSPLRIFGIFSNRSGPFVVVLKCRAAHFIMKLIFLCATLSLFVSFTKAAPAIADVDRIRIAEVYRIGEKLQDRLWPGWSTAPFGILFITDDNEFLIRHPKPNNEFVSIKLCKSRHRF